MALPSIADLKMWVGSLLTKDDWNYNFSQLVSWLADGTSDIVVNSVKATNGIDMNGAQISNIGAATSGSQAINLDQAETLLNRSSNYYPFSVASGKVDVYGNSAYLAYESSQIVVYGGNTNPDLVCVQSDGTIESVTSNTTLSKPAANGTYHIIKEKGQSITITASSSNKVTIGKVQPTSDTTVGDYFLNNSVIPFQGRKLTADGWEDVDFCYIGTATVDGDDVTLKTFDYNYNRFDVNIAPESGVMLRPDYSKAIGVEYSSGDAVGFNGWLGVDAKFSASSKIEKFCINNIPVFIGRGGTDGGIVDACGGVVLVSENDVITWELTYGTSLNTVTFYKMPFAGGQ